MKREEANKILSQQTHQDKLTYRDGWWRSYEYGGPGYSNLTQSLRGHFIRSGLLCKDCHRYIARARYSVCKRCYERRVQKLVNTGGVYVLTPAMQKQIDRELR